MTTIRHTTLEELYEAYGALILRSTGRPWTRKKGIQARPKKPYATLHIQQVETFEKTIVENVELFPFGVNGEIFEQLPWNTSLLNMEVAFYSDRAGDTVEIAASRFRSALALEARYWDLWLLSALAGRIQAIDLSLIFREDVEPRIELRFQIMANIVEQAPLADYEIYEIKQQQIDITHVGIDTVETEIQVVVNDNESS